MIPSKQVIRSSQSWPWWRFELTALSALGLGLSVYLSWHFLRGGAVIGCGGGSACEQVLSSRWSTVGGMLPTSGLAAGTYLAILLASFFIGPRTPAPDRRMAWGAMLILASAAAGSAVWFIIVQTRMIGAFCPYCMATHLTSLVLTALVLWKAPQQSAANPTQAADANPAPAHLPPRLIRRLPALGLSFIGLALAAGLAVSQLALKPPAVSRGGDSQDIAFPSIDPHTLPVVGSPDSQYVVILQFDYNCRHCQKLHSMLEEVIRHYDGKLAFALCPAPLNNQCNPYISRSVAEFKDSCELARIALALWFADPRAFDLFDKWVFTAEPGLLWRPRSLDDARAKAAGFLGASELETALADPRVDALMQTSVRIYGQTLGPDQSGNAVPKLIFNSRWVTPEPADTEQFLEILHTKLGLPNP